MRGILKLFGNNGLILGLFGACYAHGVGVLRDESHLIFLLYAVQQVLQPLDFVFKVEWIRRIVKQMVAPLCGNVLCHRSMRIAANFTLSCRNFSPNRLRIHPFLVKSGGKSAHLM